MILYAQTELDTYYREPAFDRADKFLTVRYGWYSFAFLHEGGGVLEAFEIARAILLLADEKHPS